MKKIIPVLMASALMLIACGPSRYSMHVEMRYPSKSGMDLAGKDISVVFLENGDSLNNAMLKGMADGFAYSLEQDYGTGEGSVSVYRMSCTPGAKYSDKDSLISLIIDTGSDVVFLLDTLTTGKLTIGTPERVASPSSPDSAFISVGSMPFATRMYSYDSMDRKDKVYSFSGNSVAAPHAYSDGADADDVIMQRTVSSIPLVGIEAGKALSSSFKSEWKHEQYSIVYFDSQQWYRALAYAEQYRWKNAMDIWMDLADTDDLLKRSCAEYNMAVSCYMSGDCELALQWLDKSDKDTALPFSESLRKRITARM